MLLSVKIKEPVKCVRKMSSSLSVTAFVIFLSFDNVSLSLERATQFFFKCVESRLIFEKSAIFLLEREIRT